MSRILICHRPEDSADFVARLTSHLCERFGETCLAPGGSNLPAADAGTIAQAVQACAVILVIIGPQWLGKRDSPDARSIDDERDPTRLQLEAALAANRPIIVILAPGGTLPDREHLPHSLSLLAQPPMPPIRARDDAWDPWFGTLTEWLEEIFMGRDWQFKLVHWVGGATGDRVDYAPDPSVDRRGTSSPPSAPASAPPQAPVPAQASAPSPPSAPAPASAAPARAKHKSRIADLFGSWVDKLADLRKTRSPAPNKRRGRRAKPLESAPWPDTQSGPSPDPRIASTAPRPPGVATPEPVHLGASAPQAVKPGSEFTARFVAYVKGCEEETLRLVQQLSPRSTAQLGLQTCLWQPGTRVEVVLSARGLKVAPERQQFIWQGSRSLLEFDIGVPKDTELDVTVLKFDVLIEGVAVARLRLDVEISAIADPSRAAVSAKAARTAFASYSAQDRQRVLDRLAALRISAGLDIFLDCMSLHPSEAWKAQLEEEIRERELFLLFWSAAASKSQWVDWEWHTALRARGKGAMQIHPLEVGIQPPDELKDLHFGDAYMLARAAYGAQNTERLIKPPRGGKRT